LEELELIKRCRQADRLAQELLYSRYADRLYRITLRYVKIQLEAEDVLIIALNKVFSSLESFSYQEKGSLEAWMKRIVINESLMWLRKKHNFNLTETIDENTPEPNLKAVAETQGEDILRAISELPTGYRTVFNLNVIEGYEHGEIAGMLGISANTSRSQLFKAKAMLQKMLSKEGVYYGT